MDANRVVPQDIMKIQVWQNVNNVIPHVSYVNLMRMIAQHVLMAISYNKIQMFVKVVVLQGNMEILKIITVKIAYLNVKIVVMELTYHVHLVVLAIIYNQHKKNA